MKIFTFRLTLSKKRLFTLFFLVLVSFNYVEAQNFEATVVTAVVSGNNSDNALFAANSPSIPLLAFIRAERIAGPQAGTFTIQGDNIRYIHGTGGTGIPNNASTIRFTFLQADQVTLIPLNDFRFIINDIDGPNNEALATDCDSGVRFVSVYLDPADPNDDSNLVLDNTPPDLSATGTQVENAGIQSRVMYEYNDVNVVEYTNFANNGFLKDFDLDNELSLGTPQFSVCSKDTDNDGVDDVMDQDDDNDGILDVVESGGNDPNGDADGDGLPNFLDTDDNTGDNPRYTPDGSTTDYTDLNSDGQPDVYEASQDDDELPNHLDLDSDGDGIPDNVEAQGTDTYVAPSATSDLTTGIPTNYNQTTGLTPIPDTDLDGIDDYLDLDSDGDNFDDTTESGLTLTGLDEDNDGLDDGVDTTGGPTGDYSDPNGSINNPRTDLPDNDNPGNEVDFRDPRDSDNDGVADNIDLDDDNDGIPDTAELAGINDPFGDEDGDGLLNINDAFDNNGPDGDGSTTDYTDLNNDGVPDVYDYDGDGIPNHLDLDGDNDGIPDVIEAGGTDTNGDGVLDGFIDIDNDGLSDSVDNVDSGSGLGEVTLGTPLPSPNTDLAGNPNYLDIDSDGDGIPDNIEAQPTTAYLAPLNTDSDGDGIDDRYDSDQGGATLLNDPENTDGTDTPDYIDTDSDNDGVFDIVENGDDDNVASGTDSDNDGLDDAFDDVDDSATGEPTVNDGINPPNATNLGDEDGDFSSGGDVDFRDIFDNDNDGIADNVDLDDDNDGILDTAENSLGIDPSADNDNDGIPNYQDQSDRGDGNPATCTDTTPANGICDGIDPLFDSDNDGVPNHHDLDSDNDGIPDNVEAQPTIGYIQPSGVGAGITDGNNNGVDDNYETAQGGTDLGAGVNSDTDLLPDFLDINSDDEGDNDTIEAGFTPAITTNDSDGDGILDDYDDINGPIVQDDQTFGAIGLPNNQNPPTTEVDFREDIIGVDTDGDNSFDTVDLDDDNDGILDTAENTLGVDPSADADSDGIPNYQDFDDNGSATAPVCLDGDLNGICDTLDPAFDNDQDGVPNHYDIDSDNDGIYDVIETGGTDANNDGRADDDDNNADNTATNGIPTSAGAGVSTPTETTVGTPDYLNLDSDSDGCSDANEAYASGTADGGDTGVYGPDPATVDSSTGVVTSGTPVASYAAPADGDNDGTDDYQQVGGPDGDGDGISDACDPVFDDNDNDGVGDAVDLDDDNDGILDTAENTLGVDPSADADGDGIPNYQDFDDNGSATAPVCLDGDLNGICDTLDPAFDNDQDGVPNHYDIDSDNDGIYDVIETGGTDANNDGRADDDDNNADNTATNGIPTSAGAGVSTPTETTVGTPDYLNLDSDSDGCSDANEAYASGTADGGDTGVYGPDPATVDSSTGVVTSGTPVASYAAPADGDNDGTDDYQQVGGPDGDGDGISDACDPVFDDNDNDGVGDAVDLDDDNDGILDTAENTLGVNPSADADGDGIPNYQDFDDNGSATAPVCLDADLNGICDTLDPAFDNDQDGVPNHYDIDSDNDGIYDVIETGGTDANNDGRADDDDNNADNTATNGIPTSAGAGVSTPTETTVGTPDYLNLDSDSDGCSDANEAYASGTADGGDTGVYGPDPATVDSSTGVVTSGTPVASYAAPADGDNDGTDDYQQVGGPDGDGDGISDACDPVFDDNDNDGVGDAVDLDDDNDGILDTAENTLGVDPSADADGDGIPNYQDFDDNGSATAPVCLDGDLNGICDTLDPAFDNDQDGVPNHYDIDSDNDGIYDVIETGGTDANNDGRADDDDNNADNTATNGIPTSAGAGVSTPTETTAGTPDYLNLDSDSDGCSDANEAYASGTADGGDTGVYGPDPATVDSSTGVVTSGTPVASYAAPADGDNDGTDDYQQIGGPDGDGDGISDACDPVFDDNDGDGVGDAVDLDDDNDGILDTAENTLGVDPSADADADGIPNYQDFDDNGSATAPVCLDADLNGICDTLDPAFDNDQDGVPNHYDIDSDNDGIYDVIETGGTDANNDGRADDDDNNADNTATNGIPTSAGAGVSTPTETTVGTPDYLNLDSDSDGCSDANEAYASGTADGGDTGVYGPDPATVDSSTGVVTSGTPVASYAAPADGDNDGTDDYQQIGGPDGDFDGISDACDPTFDNNDGDNVGDNLDLDDDNDGIPDTAENTLGVDPSADADADGIPNYQDFDDNGSATAPVCLDADLNGICDTLDPAFDNDRDGIPNHFDLDSDNDGITDIIEAGGVDTNFDGEVDYPTPGDPSTMVDIDKDGLDDALDNIDSGSGMGEVTTGTPLPTPNSDTDTNPNFLDIDADNDGIVDNIEAQSTLDYVVPSGNDTDNDGLDDSYDPDCSIALCGFNGTPIVPVNTDASNLNSDTDPDYIDSDSDGDGESDTIEAYDTDDDGVADTVPSGNDTDNDGLDDNFDIDGANATDTGGPTNGGQTATNPFPDTDAVGGEPNWREDIEEITFTKTFAAPVDVNINGIVDAGDTIEYTLSITNTGNVSVTAANVTDTKLGLTNAAVTPANLAPGATGTLTSTYTILQSDVDAGGIENTATGSATPPNLPDGSPATPITDTSDTDVDGDGNNVPNNETVETPLLDGTTPGDGTDNDPTVTLIPASSELTTTKTSVLDITGGLDATVADVGDMITYTYTLENTGNTTLTSVGVSETAFSGTAGAPTPVFGANSGVTPSSPSGTLVPGETATFSAMYALTQADIDAGGIQNSATATGTPPADPDGTVNAAITDVSDAGDETVETPNLDGSLPADGTDNDPTVTLIPPSSELTTTKTSVLDITGGLDATVADVGDMITYTYTIENTGNTTLTSVGVSETAFSGTAGAPTPVFGANSGVTPSSPSGTLVPGETATFSAMYALTQADIDAGGIQNSATATGTPPADPDGTVNAAITDVSDAGDETVETPDINGNTDGNTTNDPTITSISPSPELVLTKTAVINDGGDGIVDANDTITYTFSIENTGNVTIDNIEVTDLLTGSINLAITPSILTPGAVGTATVVYTILQTDIDNGDITNTATVTGDSPTGVADVTDVSDNGDETTDGPDVDIDPTNDPTVTMLTPNPSILITKTDNAPADGSYDTVGEAIFYEIEVTNDGNVTLSNIVITDPNADTINPATVSSIDPGQTVTVIATHVITQADIDLGIVTNTASVTAQDHNTTIVNDDSDDPDTPALDDATITSIVQNPELTLTKSDDPAPDGTYDTVGEVITYTIEVINTGTVTLTNVVVSDTNADAGSIIPASITTMAPGDRVTVIASHTIIQEDLDAGIVINQADVTGDDPNGISVTDMSDDPSTPDPDDATETETGLITGGRLSVTKAADPRIFAEEGDVITYTIVIENTGTVTLSNIIVVDNNATIISGLPITSLAPGEMAMVLAEHVVTNDDILTGQVINVAEISGTTPSGEIITEISDDPNNLDDVDPDADSDPDDPTISSIDSDGDGIVDPDDLDDDNDGIADIEEQNGDPNLDTDGDGIVDRLDLDSDGDGVLDVYESGADVDVLTISPDGRIEDIVGTDGIPNSVQNPGEENGGTINYPVQDTDGDGIDDFQDIDDDNDDILTVDENADPDGNGNPDDAFDTDGNGIPNYLEPNVPSTGEDGITVFTGMSPNGDGINDAFVISGIERLENTLEIYNRWGVKVFQASNYGRDGNLFKGISNGRTTIEEKDQLPVGTYYYLLEYVLESGERKSRAGYLYINR